MGRKIMNGFFLQWFLLKVFIEAHILLAMEQWSNGGGALSGSLSSASGPLGSDLLNGVLDITTTPLEEDSGKRGYDYDEDLTNEESIKRSHRKQTMDLSSEHCLSDATSAGALSIATAASSVYSPEQPCSAVFSPRSSIGYDQQAHQQAAGLAVQNHLQQLQQQAQQPTQHQDQQAQMHLLAQHLQHLKTMQHHYLQANGQHPQAQAYAQLEVPQKAYGSDFQSRNAALNGPPFPAGRPDPAQQAAVNNTLLYGILPGIAELARDSLHLKASAIIFDWDDTLFPTTYIRDVVVHEELAPLLEDLSPEEEKMLRGSRRRYGKLREDSVHYPELAAYAKLVEQLLYVAFETGAKVGLITSSSAPWVHTTARFYLPGFDLGLLEKVNSITTRRRGQYYTSNSMKPGLGTGSKNLEEPSGMSGGSTSMAHTMSGSTSGSGDMNGGSRGKELITLPQCSLGGGFPQRGFSSTGFPQADSPPVCHAPSSSPGSHSLASSGYPPVATGYPPAVVSASGAGPAARKLSDDLVIPVYYARELLPKPIELQLSDEAMDETIHQEAKRMSMKHFTGSAFKIPRKKFKALREYWIAENVRKTSKNPAVMLPEMPTLVENVLSIGDSEDEKFALIDMLWRKEPPKESDLIPQFYPKIRSFCKTIKMVDNPALDEIIQQIKVLTKFLPQFMAHESDFHVDFADPGDGMPVTH